MRARLPRSLVIAFAFACAAPAHGALRAVTNGILTVEVQDAGADVGMFTIRTGSGHPHPEQSVLYHAGTSYATLRDNTSQEIWTNAGTIVNTDIAPYAFRPMQQAPATTSIDNLPDGFRVIYTLPNWRVQHEITILGGAIADTRVRHAITLTNLSTVERSYGLRNLWDWDTAGIDALHFRTLDPAGPLTQVFFATTMPAFGAFENLDDPGAPTFRSYGTGSGETFGATPPDRFGYVAWQDLFEAPWDTPIIGEALDSATVHYWGFVTPLLLAPGTSATFTQFASVSASAIGIAADVAAAVPTLSHGALPVMTMLLLLASLSSFRAVSPRAGKGRHDPRA